MAATNYSSMNFNLGPASKVEKQNALRIKKQASPQTASPTKTNKYMGMSDAAIKKAYIGMTQAQKKANGIAMAKASQANKGKKKNTVAKSVKSASKTTSSKPTVSAKPKVDPQRNTGSGRDGKFGLGTSGKGRPTNPVKAKERQVDGVGPSRKQRKKDMSSDMGETSKTSYKPKGAARAGSRASNSNNKSQVRYESSNTTPKEGDKKRVSGILKVYKNGRWVKVGKGRGTR